MNWYSAIARPLLFRLDPERAHDLTMAALRMPGASSMLASFHNPRPTTHDPRPESLSQRLWNLHFPNPIGLAAGLDKQGTAVAAWSALGFGFAEVGTVTPRPQPGNAKPRLFRLPADHAVINRFGFNSEGAAAVARNLSARPVRKDRPYETLRPIQKDRPYGAERPIQKDGPYASDAMRLGLNVGKNKETANEAAADDYVRSIEALHAFADYFVVNVSSPNTAGLRSLQQDATLRPLLEQCVAAARRVSGREIPVLVKLSPDMTDDELRRSADAAIEGGATGIIATNTTLARDGLLTPEAYIREAGGLSGVPLRRRANEACRVLFRHLHGRVPIIGVGGIFTVDDAYERIRSGASLIQIYTALIYEGPGLVSTLVRGLAERLARDGFTRLEEAIGIDAR